MSSTTKGGAAAGKTKAPRGGTTRRRRGRPRASEEPVIRPGEILDGALKMFAERGYEAASVRSLARELGVSHNLVHHYFGSKQELWEAAVARGFGSVEDELLVVLDGADPEEDELAVIRRTIERYVVVSARQPYNLNILLQEGANPGPRLDLLLKRFMAPSNARFQRLIDRAREKGRIRAVRPSEVFLLVQCGALPFSLESLLERIDRREPQGRPSVERQASAYADMVMRTLAAD